MGEIATQKPVHNFIDLTGQRFGRLVVVSRAESKNQRTMWNCVCDCGKKVVVGSKDIRNGKTKSCGCYHKDNYAQPPRMIGRKNPSYKHGGTGTKLYWIWSSMVQRCTNENDKRFQMYGARGITVCDEWLNGFGAFCEWAMMNGYSEGLSIDRIDNDGNYCPENCRWTDSVVQSNNRRNNIMITRNNETHTLSEWARIKKLPYKTILERYYRHGDTEDLLRGLKK